MDRFKSMKELENVTVENEDWEIETDDKDSNVSILAIHGGGIEPATTELAQVIADKGNFTEVDIVKLCNYKNLTVYFI